MNLVYLFLCKFRDFCMSMFFDQNLDLYVGDEEWINNRKEFYRSFICNVAFDKKRYIYNEIAFLKIDNSVNPVYVIAKRFFDELQKTREDIKYPSRDIDYIYQLSQVLMVLKIHFCKYDENTTFGLKTNYFDTKKDEFVTSPDEWHFIDNELIWHKLMHVDCYPIFPTYIYSHKLRSNFIESFAKEITRGAFDRKLLFSENAYGKLLDSLEEKGYRIEIPFEEGTFITKRSFSKETIESDSIRRRYYDFYFIKELGSYYCLAGFSYKEYSFDVTEYRDEVSDHSYNVCLDERISELFGDKSKKVSVNSCNYIDIYQ